ncbi:MAG: hypothetical protein R3E68_13265 [Burkholderiaceae bacterium]
MNKTFLTLGLAIIVSLSAGCASSGNRQAADAGRSIEEISKQYRQGSDLVASGEKVKQDADRQIEAATAKRAEGQSMVQRGESLMAESEEAFRMKAKSGKIR